MITWDAVWQFPTHRAGPNSKDRFLSQQRQEEATANSSDSSAWFEQRDEIKGLIQSVIGKHGTAHWMAIFSERDVWASEVLEWDELLDSEAFDELCMLQQLEHAKVDELLTTRLPIRIDGEVLRSPKAAPRLGEHTADITAEFGLES